MLYRKSAPQPIVLLFFLLLLPVLTRASEVHWDPVTLRNSLQPDIEMLKRLASEPIVEIALIDDRLNPRTMDQIGERDRLWQQSAETPNPIQQALLSSPASRYLQKYVNEHSMLAELILTNHLGENVALYPLTSDYWQGDEAQWQASFISGEVYVGIPQLDVSSSTNVVKVSVPVWLEGEVAGVLIAAIKLSHVFYRQVH